MAQGDMVMYNGIKGKLGDGSVDWDTNTIKVALLTGYTPNKDTHVAWSDISASEITAANYTAGGVAITPSTPTIDTTNDWAEYDATDAAWTSLGAPSGAINYAIVYKDSGVAASSWLISYIEITTQSNGGNYTIAWHADGVFKVS